MNNQRHLLNECPENTRNLFRKLWKAEATPRDLSLANILHKIKRDIQDTNADRLRQEHDNTQLRLRQWKARYQTGNITAISKWIQRKEQKAAQANVTLDGQTAKTDAEAAQFVHRFWKKLWQDQAETQAQNPLSEEDVAQMLAEHFPQACRQTWEPPSYWHLHSAVRSCQGSAGVDSWSSDEIRYLPDDAISDFYKLACR